ncbi:MAG TPA: hypothetical protein VFZ91_01715, partial [Allosphingosinicella sp.]
IANLAKRHQQGIPTDLDKVSSIHFGRMIIIRPEQYLLLSESAADLPEAAGDRPGGADGRLPPAGEAERPEAWDGFSSAYIPEPVDDDFEEIRARSVRGRQPIPSRPRSRPRSWLLTLVEFDGELKSYMREIAYFLGPEFDRIFDNCDFYPRTANFEKFWLWIRTFQINTDLFYATYRDLSVVRIRQLEAFKRRFDAFVARVRSPTGPIVRSMDEMFDEFLRENQQYASGFPAPGGTYPTDEGR